MGLFASRRKRLATAQERLADLGATELAGGLKVFAANSWAERRDGLGGLPDLPPDWGLHIPRCSMIHTIGMRFPLDLVWLDGSGAVVRVDHDVPPRRQRACIRARSVIEVNSGQGDRFAQAWVPRSV